MQNNQKEYEYEIYINLYIQKYTNNKDYQHIEVKYFIYHSNIGLQFKI